MNRRDFIRDALAGIGKGAAIGGVLAIPTSAQAVVAVMPCGHLGNGLHCWTQGCPNRQQFNAPVQIADADLIEALHDGDFDRAERAYERIQTAMPKRITPVSGRG